MKKILFLLATFILFFGIASQAAACSCAYFPNIEEYLERMEIKAIFSGKVINLDSSATKYLNPENAIRATFDVYNIWQGKLPKSTVVTTNFGGTMCEYPFEVGTEYLVFANDYNRDGVLETTSCSRTQLLTQAKEDLNYLNSHYQPVAPALVNQPTGTFFSQLKQNSLLIGGGLIILAVIFGLTISLFITKR